MASRCTPTLTTHSYILAAKGKAIIFYIVDFLKFVSIDETPTMNHGSSTKLGQ